MNPTLPDPEHDLEPPPRPGFWARLRSNFLTGLVFIAPIAVTIWFIWWAINAIDNLVRPIIPVSWRPETYVDFHIPGVGVIFFLVVATLTGWLTKGIVGAQIKRFVFNFVNQFPIIRSIYNALRQIIETVFSQDGQNFQNAVMVEYPRKGIYAIGFLATRAKGEILEKSGQDELLAIFIPTTPNPTSGFFLYFPRKDVKILDMSVEDAAKLVISSGLVEPEKLTLSKNEPR